MDLRTVREDNERFLSKYATKNSNSKGRLIDEEKCPLRTDFERDHNRILYSVDFRRLRHKTQVFFNAKNDHICTRMEHVLYVGSIATTVARTLNLNQDLAYAVALGHDLGHAPFGHTGERVLDECVKKINNGLSFKHELHSLRVVDRLAARASSVPAFYKEEEAQREPGIKGSRGPAPLSGDRPAPNPLSREGSALNPPSEDRTTGAQSNDDEGGQKPQHGLNLTFEVRDGIVCHCGENYDENRIEADRGKGPDRLMDSDVGEQRPATLEACVVRLVDKIAYVGRDIEDAVRAGIIGLGDISKEVLGELGYSNGQIINTLVCDLIENSLDKDYIALSKDKGEALKSLIKENIRTIYKSWRISEYERSMSNAMEGLFNGLYHSLQRGVDRLKRSNEKVLRMFGGYIEDQCYSSSESPEQMALDFVAGMTDGFALQCYEEMYWV